MTKPVKAIVAKVTDEAGWPFEQAVVVFYHIAEKSVRSYDAEESNPVYKESSDIESVSYTANFWMNSQVKQQGMKSKPVYVLDENKNITLDDDNEPERVFTVDTAKPQYAQIMQRGGHPIDVLTAIIEKHYREEVAR